MRRSRAKPRTGWSLRELAALVGLAPRTLRLYVDRGVIPRPPFRASATRYERPHLLRLVVARRLLAAERLSLEAIYRRLQSLDPREIERLATTGLPPGPLASALGVAPAPAPAPPERPSARIAPTAPRWVRIELALGLELHLREDASEDVRLLARRIVDGPSIA